MQYVEPAKQFAKDSIRLVKRCTKPDRKGSSMSALYAFFIFIFYKMDSLSDFVLASD